MFRRTAAAILTAATLVAAAPEVRADEPVTPLPPAAAPREPRVEWNPAWRKLRLWEYFATVGIQAASLYVRWYHDPPTRARWVGYNAADDTVRGWLVAGTREDRELAGLVSDRITQFGSAVPWAVTLPVVVLGYQQYRLAWQMAWMNFEAIAVANFLNNVSFYLVGRGRPSTHSCNGDPSYDGICGGIGNNASFPSGHTVTIATAAGLTCVHHTRMPILDNKVADRGICAAMLLATLATGITRMMADRHFASDVFIGAALGLGSGFGLPTVMHYGLRSTETAAPAPRQVTLVPFGDGRSVGLGLVGIL
jgi:membrane-associated phospholipid phosphatase